MEKYLQNSVLGDLLHIIGFFGGLLLKLKQTLNKSSLPFDFLACHHLRVFKIFAINLIKGVIFCIYFLKSAESTLFGLDAILSYTQ